MTKDESRAVTFLAVLLCLALLARYINRPKPVTINASAVNIEALRDAGRSLAQQPQPARSRTRAGTTAPPQIEKSAGPINVNHASARELEALPGIGPAVAKRIVARRDSIGRFEKLEDLDAVKGIGPALLKRIAPLVTF